MFDRITKNTGWKVVNLEEQLEQIIDNRGKTPKKSETGIPSLSAKSVKMGAIEYSKAYYVSQETYNKFMVRGLPKVGDVLLTTEAPLGCVARLDRDDVCLAQRLITLRGKAGVLDNDYLRFYLSSRIGQHELTSRASGSTVQGIKRSEFSKISIVLPPYEKQLEIVSWISSIEKKINLNIKINETLESIGQALFDSWFINFEPVRAKLEARERGQDPRLAAMAAISGKPFNELETLSSEQKESLGTIADLFSDDLVETEVGIAPYGWEVEGLENSISVKHGYAFPSKNFSEEPTKNILLTPGNFKIGGGIKLEKLKYYDGEIPEEYVLGKHDLLITMTDLSKKSDTLGFPALVHSVGNYVFLHNQRLGKVVSKGGVLNVYFLYFLFKSYRYRNEIVGSATGTTVKHTAPKRIIAYKYPRQPKLEAVFNRKMKSLYDLIESNKNDTAILEGIRGSLLPRLLEGEIGARTERVGRENAN